MFFFLRLLLFPQLVAPTTDTSVYDNQARLSHLAIIHIYIIITITTGSKSRNAISERRYLNVESRVQSTGPEGSVYFYYFFIIITIIPIHCCEIIQQMKIINHCVDIIQHHLTFRRYVDEKYNNYHRKTTHTDAVT